LDKGGLVGINVSPGAKACVLEVHVDCWEQRRRSAGGLCLSLRENTSASADRARGRLGWPNTISGCEAGTPLPESLRCLVFRGLRCICWSARWTTACAMPCARESSTGIPGAARKDIARIVAEARQGSPIEPVQEVVQRDVEFYGDRSARQDGRTDHFCTSRNHSGRRSAA
jgi:hypothetical protein